MTEMKKRTVSNLVRNFILVILAGVVSAILVAGLSIFYFSPSGTYHVGNVLMEPQVVKTLRYQDVDPKTGEKANFVFDRIEFLHFDSLANKWKKENFSLEQYREFYAFVENDISVSDIPGNIAHLFAQGTPAMLSVVVRKEGTKGQLEQAHVLQEVQISTTSDYYRVLLRKAGSGQEYVYFLHPGLLNRILAIAGVKE